MYDAGGRYELSKMGETACTPLANGEADEDREEPGEDAYGTMVLLIDAVCERADGSGAESGAE